MAHLKRATSLSFIPTLEEGKIREAQDSLSS